jgi:Putative transposase
LKPTTALRYCARPPFAMDRLRKEGAELVYRCAKQRSEPTSDRRGAKIDELHLTPLELIDRIAALVPPPRNRLLCRLSLPARPWLCQGQRRWAALCLPHPNQ